MLAGPFAFRGDEMGREFSDEELRVLGLRSIDALTEAVEAGDRAAALGFAKRLRRAPYLPVQFRIGANVFPRCKYP